MSPCQTFPGKENSVFFPKPEKKTVLSENELVSKARTFPGKKKYDTFVYTVKPQLKKKVKVESERKVDVKSEMVVDHIPITSTNQDPDNSQ